MNSLKGQIYCLLRWSEKYTKTDMVYLGKGSFWLGLGQAATSLSALALAITFGNLLSQESYGIYKYILSIAGLLTIATLPGTNIALTQAISRGYDKTFTPILKAKIHYGTLGLVISIMIGIYYFYQGNNLLGTAFLITALFIPIFDSFALYHSIIHGKKKFKLSSVFEITSQITATSSLIATLFLTSNILIVVFVYFSVWSALRALFFVITTKTLYLNNKIDTQAVPYGKHLSLIKGIGIAAGTVSNIALFQILGAQGLAIFSFAIAPVEQIRSLFKNLETLTLPKFSDSNWKIYRLKEFLSKISPLIYVLGISVIIYIFAAPFLYQTFFPKYLDAVKLSQIYATSILFTATNSILISILRAQRATKKLHFITIVENTSLLVLAIPAVYYFGIIGLILTHLGIKATNTFLMAHLIFAQPDESEKEF